MLDIEHGNVTQDEAERLGTAAGRVDSGEHTAGSTEPWVSRLVADLIVARGARTVLETGAYMGATSVWIADALDRLGGGRFHLCEIDKARRGLAVARVADGDWRNVTVLEHGDVMEFLCVTKEEFDLVWLDDSHEKSHVTKELILLLPKMASGGLVLLHDVFGSCDLQSVVNQFGGYSIGLPRLGPAGGLGVIQVR